MQINSRSFLPARNKDLLIAAIAGFFIIYAFTRHGGIGVSPDSVTYLSVAAHIHDHQGLTDFHSDPLVDFPAGYPLFLSVIRWLSVTEPLRFAPLLNGFLFAVLIYLSGWLIGGSMRSIAPAISSRSKACKWLLLAAIVSSPCLLEIYSMLWSETLFLILLLLFFLFLDRYFLSGATGTLAVAGLIAGLAFVTRYAGISLIGTGALLLLCDPQLRPLRKGRQILVFGGSALLFPAINLCHNLLAGGALIGKREKGITSFGSNLHDFGSVFCDWLHIPNDHPLLVSAVGLGWILLFIGVVFSRLRRRERLFSVENIATAFFIVYASFILVSATLSRFQQLDSRLLSPLFIPWLWGSASLVAGWLASHHSTRRRVLFLAVVLAVISLLAGQGLADRETWQDIKDGGIPGYTDDDWRRSATMQFARKNASMLQSDAGLYSNAYDALWFLGDLRADLLPHKDFPGEINRLLARDRLYVVWFNDGINTDLIDIALISRYKRLAGMFPFDDGTVYFFTPK